MANAKRNTVVSAEALGKARSAIAMTFSEIYALDDIGRNLTASKLSHYTIAKALESFAESACANLAKAERMLPPGHAAVNEVLNAIDHLESLGQFGYAQADDDGWKFNAKTVGDAVFELTVRAAKAIERAEIACGGCGSGGYLNGSVGDPNRGNVGASEVSHG